MIDWTKPIETADGRAAKLLSRGYWRNGETYCVVQFEDDDGNSEIVIVNPTTGYHAWSHKGPFRNVRVKRKGWILKRKFLNLLGDYRVFENEKDAFKASSLSEQLIRIEWEEEQ